jgi:predicted AAA+ superfamily ATPase
MHFKNRDILAEIKKLSEKTRGRIIVLTGARQVGKSTLAKHLFPNQPYINLDSPLEREVYSKMSTAQWLAEYPCVTIDEVQKSPQIFNEVKACYDRDEKCHFLLLGSSQVLLLKGIQETLAGRAAIRELYPFTLPELMGLPDSKTESLLMGCLSNDDPMDYIEKNMKKDDVLGKMYALSSKWWDYYLKWGGMPSLLQEDWDDNDRFEWLQDYHKTYLQRDLLDLANLEQLEPFVRAQRTAALRTSERVNYSDLARASDISAPTAKKFLRYLEVSYQVILLPAWHRNSEKRLSKMPKLHFLDPGICRSIRQKRGDVSGHELETALVSEVYKQIKNARIPIDLYHIRSSDGREVDLLLEREDGYIAIECKQTIKTSKKDSRHLRGLHEVLDKPLLLSIVVSNDIDLRVEKFAEEKVIYCSFSRLLGLV